MPEKTVAQKARVKPEAKVAVVNRVPKVVEGLGLPKSVRFVTAAKADLVFLFVRSRAELDKWMPKTARSLRPGSAVWVFFKKGSKESGLDMNRDTVWAAADRLRMRPLGIVSIDETWAAFRLRPGREGD